MRQIAEALRNRGLRVWLDEWELVPGRPWQEALEEIIRTTLASAVLVGKDGLGPWEIPEMRACLSEFVDRKSPVIPVLLPGAPEKPELPLFLRAFTWVDLRSGLTPDGLDRLVWGITGERGEPASADVKSFRGAEYRDWDIEDKKSNRHLPIPNARNPPRIFISYSHRDERWKDDLLLHLGVLQEEGMLQVWNDRDIDAGADWLTEIKVAIDSSSVAILLISAHFLTSRFIRSQEIPRLLRRRTEEGMIVFPVIVGSCLWRKIDWLANLQVRPKDGTPLANRRGDRVHAELSAIVEEILDLLNR